MATGASATADLHIIVTRDGLIIARHGGAGFRELQEQYDGYMTSLGPMDADGVLDTFENEWPDVLVTHHDAIRTFIRTALPAADAPRELRL